MRSWFNDALRPVLLFRPEHDQLEMQRAEKGLPQELCDIYGPSTRTAFCEAPRLAASPLDSDSQKFLEARLGELVRWLARRERDPAAVYFSESCRNRYTKFGCVVPGVISLILFERAAAYSPRLYPSR